MVLTLYSDGVNGFIQIEVVLLNVHVLNINLWREPPTHYDLTPVPVIEALLYLRDETLSECRLTIFLTTFE